MPPEDLLNIATYSPTVTIPLGSEARTIDSLRAAFTALTNRTTFSQREILRVLDPTLNGVSKVLTFETLGDLVVLDSARRTQRMVAAVANFGSFMWDENYPAGFDAANVVLRPLDLLAEQNGRWIALPSGLKNVPNGFAGLDADARAPAAIAHFAPVFAKGATGGLFRISATVPTEVPGTSSTVTLQPGDFALIFLSGEVQTQNLEAGTTSTTQIAIIEPDGNAVIPQDLQAKLIGTGSSGGNSATKFAADYFTASKAGVHTIAMQTFIDKPSVSGVGGPSALKFFLVIFRP